MQGYSRLLVDLEAIRNNWNMIKKRMGMDIMPMIKGNGYGAGMVELARFFHQLGAPIVGVSHLQEAIALRESGYNAPIFVLSIPPRAIEASFAYKLEIALNSYEELEKYISLKKPVVLHLQIDTGLNRFGFSAEEGLKVIQTLEKYPWIQLNGIMSHIISMDEKIISSQIQQFRSCIDPLHTKPRWIHLESSKSLFNNPIDFCNLARVGLHLFGTKNFGTPALTLQSEVVALRKCQKGERVGYGGLYQVTQEYAIIATIGIGYHDGVHLGCFGKGHVLLHGKKVPYAGEVCMDFMMLEVTDIPNVKVGDMATLFGPGLPLEEVASWDSVNMRQLMACIGHRVERIFLNNSIVHSQKSEDSLQLRA
ncbi:MAG: alanine racemase [Chlamydiales bacterium]